MRSVAGGCPLPQPPPRRGEEPLPNPYTLCQVAIQALLNWFPFSSQKTRLLATTAFPSCVFLDLLL
jgi:hypothetical protein